MSPTEVFIAIGGGVGAIGAGMTLWKRFAQDSTDVAANKEERGWFARSRQALDDAQQQALKARERADKLQEINVGHAKRIALLEADNIRLRGERKTTQEQWAQERLKLEAQIASLGRRVRKLSSEEQRKALPTDFAPFKE